MTKLKESEYWAIVDMSGALYMRHSAIGSSPLYFGKERLLAEAVMEIETMAQVNEDFNESKPKIARVSVEVK
jgi:hypothetical protein